MVAESLNIHTMEKDNARAEKIVLEAGQSKKKLICIILVVFLILLSSLVLAAFAIIQVHNLKTDVIRCRTEIEFLQKEVEKLEFDVLHHNLLEDLRKFENDEAYADDSLEDNHPSNTRNDYDNEYDVNYDERENNLRKQLQRGRLTIEKLLKAKDEEKEFTEHIGGQTEEKDLLRTRRSKNSSLYRDQFVNEEDEGYQKFIQLYMEKHNLTEPPALRVRMLKKPLEFVKVLETGSPNTYLRISNLAYVKQYEFVYNASNISQPESSTEESNYRQRRDLNHDDATPYSSTTPETNNPSYWRKLEAQVNLSQLMGTQSVIGINRREDIPIIRRTIEGIDVRPRGQQKYPEQYRGDIPLLRSTLQELERRARGQEEFTAVHYSGDSSKYIVGKHLNYNGNGHLGNIHQTYKDWTPNDWVKELNMDEHFQMHQGVLKIKATGLYLVYAQIYYLDEHDINGYKVYKNQEPILQCTIMTHSANRVVKSNTCYTAGVEYINEGDEISVGDLAQGRYSLFEPGKSFFGAVKLGYKK